MKKWWAVLAMSMALICWAGCATAEEARWYYCASCEQEVVGYTEVYDEYHRFVCGVCGHVNEAEAHWFFCDDETRCGLCKERVNLSNVEIRHLIVEITHDEYKHYTVCACGSKNDAEAHYSSCDNPNTCSRCEYQFEPDADDIIHKSQEYVDVGDKHELRCSGCQSVSTIRDHLAICSNPTTCYFCGAQPEKIEYTHLGGYINVGEYHKFQCAYCDLEVEGRHYSYCYQPEICYGCDAVVSIDKSAYLHPHASMDNTVITDAKHSFDCKKCATHVEYAHVYEDGVCIICGYKKGSLQPSVPGDADGSDSVTLSDALAILAGDVSNEANADVTGDGKVNEQDALRIMQYDAGWDVTLQ